MYRYRMKYNKTGTARYISHLDLLRAFERSMRRAGLPAALSQGFNPHPLLSFAAPLPVGVEGLAEYMDMELSARLEPADVIDRLNRSLPPGISVSQVKELPAGGPALMALVDRADYTVKLELAVPANEPADDFRPGDISRCLEEFLARPDIKFMRKGKEGKVKEIDVRPLIFNIEAAGFSRGALELKMDLKTGSRGNVRPEEVVAALVLWCGMPLAADGITVTRTGLFAEGRGNLF